MSQIWIILILILISSANANPVIPILSLDKNGLYLISTIELNNSSFKGEPSYNIEVQKSSSHVNTGDNYSMNILISGVGDAIFGKMRVNIPNYIVKDENVTLKSFIIPYEHLINTSNGDVAIKFSEPYLISETTEPQFNNLIPSIYFNLNNISILGNFGEATVDGVVPYTIDFTISPNAPAGDHNIYLTLFYKSDDSWYTNSQVVPIHINKWYEKDWMQWAILLAIAAQIIPLIIPVLRRMINFLLSFLRNSNHFPP